MARPTKEGLDCFPLWKPQRSTESKFNSPNYKTRLSALRNSSSAFIKREDVRSFIFDLDNRKCVQCGSIESLTIDHIVSVYQIAKGEYPLEQLNIRGNLQTLCKSCNSGKAP